MDVIFTDALMDADDEVNSSAEQQSVEAFQRELLEGLLDCLRPCVQCVRL